MAARPRTQRVTAASLLVAGVTHYGALTLTAETLRLHGQRPPKAPVTIHEERIRQLKPFLPVQGEVGYVTTVANERIFADEKSMRNVEYLAQYVLTQYTLSPLIVRNRPNLPLVVGNFLSGPPPAGFVEQLGLVPERDFGEGLILYHGQGLQP
jgi:hypothetical protein